MSDEELEIETTNDQFEMFQEEVHYWLDYLGMKDWEIFFKHKHSDEYRAQVWFDDSGKIATFILAKKWDREVDEEIFDKEIKKVAFHEVCELLLGPLHILAKERTFSEHQLVTEIHKVVRILENTFYETSRR